MKSSICWVLVVLLLCSLGIRVAAQEMKAPFIAVHWLATNQIVIVTENSINFYTPQLQLTEQISIVSQQDDFSVVRKVAISPDEQSVAALVSETVDVLYVWEVVSHEEKFSFSDDSNTIETFAWKPDSQLISISTSDYQTGDAKIIIVSAINGMPVQQLVSEQQHGSVTALAWKPTSAVMAWYSDIIEVWNTDSEPPIKLGEIPINSPGGGLTFSPSGDELAFAINDYSANVYRIEIRDSVSLQLDRTINDNEQILNFWWGVDNIASLNYSGILNLWDSTTGAILATFDTGIISDLAWSPDNNSMVLISESDGVHIHNATTGAVLARLDTADLPEMP